MKLLAKILIWFLGILVATIITIIITIMLSAPIKNKITKYSLFYFLDKDMPIIQGIEPELNQDVKTFDRLESFIIFIDDEHSGLNDSKSSISLYKMNNQSSQEVDCALYFKDFKFEFIPLKELEKGEYFIELEIADNSNNILEKSYSFVIKEKNDIAISIRSRSYSESYINQFTDFVEKHTKTVDNVLLYIYTIVISNKSNTSYLNDIFITLEAGVTIFDWIELGNHGVTGFEAISTIESLNKLKPKGRAFSGQQSIRMEKMAPYGHVRFAILGGTYKIPTPHYSSTLPNSFSSYGTYEYDGDGIRKKYKIHDSVEIKYEQNISE